MGVKQKSKSLKSRAHQLSDTFFQLNVLNDNSNPDHDFPLFSDQLKLNGLSSIRAKEVNIFQLNIGKLCNQSCAHCHVDAGPDRKHEMMSKAHLELCLKIIEEHQFSTVDITGGAPELHKDFRWFVEACHALKVKIIVRCNLTVILSNKKYHDLPQFYAKNRVQVISSLPYFSQRRTDRQRGDGVFEDSIEALKMLNKVGYGMPESGLELNLVYNPSGAFLPDDQSSLELEFKRQLKRKYNIEFNALFAITNLPISRFLDYLIQSDNYHDYMETLVQAFNPMTLSGLMCLNTISVSWDGYIYDCDFNQMLDLKIQSSGQHIERFDYSALKGREILINQHCYGCTAGSGSSCGGKITSLNS